MFIQACLNGSRRPSVHPALPLTPDDLASDARLVAAAGAHSLHIHPRDSNGRQSLAARDQDAALAAIRACCPGLPVGTSTGLWIEPNVSQRLQRVETWTILPDYASVNFSEPGVAGLCVALLDRGVGIEAGLSTVADAQLLHQLGLAERCLRLLIEPDEEESEAALAAAGAILNYLDGVNIVSPPRLLHGSEAATWSMLDVAFQRGYATRIGFEDTLTLPDGILAKDNAELVSFVVGKWGQRRN